MKTSFSILFCLMLSGVVSCNKTEDPPVTPVGTTKSPAKEVKTFTFTALSPAVSCTIDASAKTITATLPAGTDLTKLVPTLTISDKATVSPASGLAQDFSKAVTYTVTAEDGSTQAYIATLKVDANTSSGIWTQKNNFPNDSISSGKPISLVFGDKVIVGFGIRPPDLVRSIWEYNSKTDAWLRKSDFPGEARFGVSAFVINGKGYIVGGSAKLFQKIYKELWEYDPATDKWTQKSAYPESNGFVYGVAGVVDNKAYLGTGYSPINANWYEYDPATDKWAKKASMPVSRGFNTSFVINKKVYVGTGSNANSSAGYQKDLYEYNPVANSWKQMADLPGQARDFAFGFAVNGKGYIAGGSYHDEAQSFADIYEFDPDTNKWTQKSDMKTKSRSSGVSFVLNSKVYIGLGLGPLPNRDYIKEFWTVEF